MQDQNKPGELLTNKRATVSENGVYQQPPLFHQMLTEATKKEVQRKQRDFAEPKRTTGFGAKEERV